MSCDKNSVFVLRTLQKKSYDPPKCFLLSVFYTTKVHVLSPSTLNCSNSGPARPGARPVTTKAERPMPEAIDATSSTVCRPKIMRVAVANSNFMIHYSDLCRVPLLTPEVYGPRPETESPISAGNPTRPHREKYWYT